MALPQIWDSSSFFKITWICENLRFRVSALYSSLKVDFKKLIKSHFPYCFNSNLGWFFLFHIKGKWRSQEERREWWNEVFRFYAKKLKFGLKLEEQQNFSKITVTSIMWIFWGHSFLLRIANFFTRMSTKLRNNSKQAPFNLVFSGIPLTPSIYKIVRHVKNVRCVWPFCVNQTLSG